MAETRSSSFLNEKVNALSSVIEQHDQEFCIVHQKLDAVTSLLEALSETMQGITEAGNNWQQRPQSSPPRTSSTIVTNPQQDSVIIPKVVRLEFPRFKGENPSSWVYKANQFFHLYNTLVNQKILLASYHMEDEALIWFQDAEEAGLFTSWEAFVRALYVRFGFLPMMILWKI